MDTILSFVFLLIHLHLALDHNMLLKLGIVLGTSDHLLQKPEDEQFPPRSFRSRVDKDYFVC